MLITYRQMLNGIGETLLSYADAMAGTDDDRNSLLSLWLTVEAGIELADLKLATMADARKLALDCMSVLGLNRGDEDSEFGFSGDSPSTDEEKGGGIKGQNLGTVP